ncbi:hypothetical protein BDF20DRAFT_917073 [Mycotypha africana]|uniref:uncharacterized protein n=1 Tax=Mycotypha africana TaxID=64632 RepID=UPI0023012452|nr:uncharacterized protein BDF20DRAFT_917073 [Mycotypha africana]KAI8968578.1 hypothetical protein BDF20DRAFT_917073 [Mycotypha africana]
MNRANPDQVQQTNASPLPIRLYEPKGLYDFLRQTLLRMVYAISPSISQRSTKSVGIFMSFGKFVWIEHSTTNSLYDQGYFGKGTLSRSRPTWLDRTLERTTVSLEDITMKRREQRRHKKLASKTPAAAPEEGNVINDMLPLRDLIIFTSGGMNVEKTQLDLYEAFFLKFALNALSIKNADQKPMSVRDCWEAFKKCNNSFNVNYAVYHYYRSLGWIPKNGTKFGVDFVLYQLGPEYRHADFAVVIIPVGSSINSRDTNKEEVKSWKWLLRLNRICTQVKKTLILCYVTIPNNNTDFSNLNNYGIREVIYKRWSPQKNREASK